MNETEEYSVVTVTIENSKVKRTFTFPKVAGTDFDAKFVDSEIDDNPFKILKSPAAQLKTIIFSIKPVASDGATGVYYTVVDSPK